MCPGVLQVPGSVMEWKQVGYAHHQSTAARKPQEPSGCQACTKKRKWASLILPKIETNIVYKSRNKNPKHFFVHSFYLLPLWAGFPLKKKIRTFAFEVLGR